MVSDHIFVAPENQQEADKVRSKTLGILLCSEIRSQKGSWIDNFVNRVLEFNKIDSETAVAYLVQRMSEPESVSEFEKTKHFQIGYSMSQEKGFAGDKSLTDLEYLQQCLGYQMRYVDNVTTD